MPGTGQATVSEMDEALVAFSLISSVTGCRAALLPGNIHPDASGSPGVLARGYCCPTVLPTSTGKGCARTQDAEQGWDCAVLFLWLDFCGEAPATRGGLPFRPIRSFPLALKGPVSDHLSQKSPPTITCVHLRVCLMGEHGALAELAGSSGFPSAR